MDVVTEAFLSALGRQPEAYPHTTCMILFKPRASDAVLTVNEARVLRDAFPLCSSAFVLELPGYVAVALYFKLRTRAFVPTGLSSEWCAWSVKPSFGTGVSGSELFTLLLSHCTTLSQAAQQHPLVLAAQPQSPQRARMVAAATATSASTCSGTCSAQRASACERVAHEEQVLVLQQRCEATEQRCTFLELELRRLRAEVQYIRNRGAAQSSTAAAWRSAEGRHLEIVRQ